jgi:hypothetical protein
VLDEPVGELLLAVGHLERILQGRRRLDLLAQPVEGAELLGGHLFPRHAPERRQEHAVHGGQLVSGARGRGGRVVDLVRESRRERAERDERPTLTGRGLDGASRAVEPGDEVAGQGQPGVGQLPEHVRGDPEQPARLDPAAGGEVDPVLVPRPESAGPPPWLVHASDDDVLTADTTHEVQRPVEEDPPVVGVLALAEELRARLDGDLGAGGEE